MPLWNSVAVSLAATLAVSTGLAAPQPESPLVLRQDPERPGGIAAERSQQEVLGRVRTLEGNYAEALQYYFSRVVPMRPGRKRNEAQARYFPDPDEWAARFLELVADAPGTQAEARALAWIAVEGAASSQAKAAAAKLLADYLTLPVIGRVCCAESVLDEPQLELVLQGNPGLEVRARAALELVERRFARAARLEAEAAKSSASAGGSAAPGSQAAAEAVHGEAIALLQRIEEEFGSVPVDGRTAGERAAERLYVWRHLRAGMPAPKLSGTDLAGAPMQISGQPKGTLRVLLFWRDREMAKVKGYGALRTLHVRFAPRGVEFLGVHGGHDVPRARRVETLQAIPFPSLAGGKDGGPAAQTYRVGTWPSCVLIDSAGNLLHRELPLEELGSLLESLLAEER